MRRPGRNASAGASMSCVYVAVPEKYFTPASDDFVHDVSASKRTESVGAPRPGWKLTVHGPATVASVVRVSAGTVRCVAVVARRKTTKVEPYGSSSNGTSVRPSATAYVAGVVAPVA